MDLSRKEFIEQYFGEFVSDDPSRLPYACGDCKYFSAAAGCTTSQIEAKYGCASTPACEEFELKANK